MIFFHLYLVEGIWVKLSKCPHIQGLSGHSAVVHKGIVYIFGGCDQKGNFHNTLVTYNLRMRHSFCLL
jgi:hypothetical protein